MRLSADRWHSTVCRWVLSMLALILFGCSTAGSTAPPQRNDRLPADTRIEVGAVSDISGQPSDGFREKRLKAGLVQALTQGGLLATHSGPHVFVLTAEITDFTGSALPGGHDIRHIKVTAYLHDMNGNRIGSIAAERGIRPGSTLPIGLGEQVFDQIAADITGDIRAHMNPSP